MTEKKILFTDVITCPEASNLWSTPGKPLSETKIKSYPKTGAFQPHEARKAGKNWIITKQSMERLFGPMPKREIDK